MLTLPIKKIHYEDIIKRRKLAEYRKDNPYWNKRLDKAESFAEAMAEQQGYGVYDNDKIIFPILIRNGYNKDSPTSKLMVSRTKAIGIPEWGAVPNEVCNVLVIHSVERVV